MFGTFSIEFGMVAFVVTLSLLGVLCLIDTCDAQKMFSRRNK